MYAISDSQIDYILADLRARGLHIPALQQDILDHVCCVIEREIPDGISFEAFYHQIIPRFYRRNLAEIEAETVLLLTYKNYYTMKKVMIGSGAASAILLTAGSFLKLFALPGAAILLVLGILCMCFIFLPLVLALKMKEAPGTRDKVVLGIGVLIGILYCLSTIFKVQHWPGANVMTLVTIALLAFVFIPVYLFSGIRRAETRLNTIVSTIILVAVTAMQFTLFSLKAFRAEGNGNARVENPVQLPGGR